VQLYPAAMMKQAPNDKAEQMRMMIAAYDKMGKALKATGRPIVYSLCQYGWDAPWEWAPAIAAICGAPRATCRPTGKVFTASSTRMPDWPNMRAGPLERSRHAGGGEAGDFAVRQQDAFAVIG